MVNRLSYNAALVCTSCQLSFTLMHPWRKYWELLQKYYILTSVRPLRSIQIHPRTIVLDSKSSYSQYLSSNSLSSEFNYILQRYSYSPFSTLWFSTQESTARNTLVTCCRRHLCCWTKVWPQFYRTANPMCRLLHHLICFQEPQHFKNSRRNKPLPKRAAKVPLRQLRLHLRDGTWTSHSLVSPFHNWCRYLWSSLVALRPSVTSASSDSNMDFLSSNTVSSLNLIPGKDGKITIPRQYDLSSEANGS